MIRTPPREDKRLWLTVGVILAVLLLVAGGRAPGEQVLTFLAVMTATYVGQSQWGQTRRTAALALAAEKVPTDAP